MTHYHIMWGASGGVPHANLCYDNKYESLDVLTRLGRQLYINFEGVEELTVENLDKNSKSTGQIVMGSGPLNVMWFECNKRCASPNWN